MTFVQAIYEQNGYILYPVEEHPDSDVQVIIQRFKETASGMIHHGEYEGQPMQLDIYVWKEDSFNAFATNYDGTDIIAISSGVFLMLRRVSRALVSQRLLFPQYAYQDDAPKYASEFAPRSLYNARDLDVPPFTVPELENLSYSLFELATFFVLYHEFFHIYNGHVSWMRDNLALSVFLENDGDRGEIADYYLETFEYDADLCALQRCMSLALNPKVSTVNGIDGWTLDEQTSFGSILETWRGVVHSIFLATIMMSISNRRDPFDESPSCHPHIAFRMTYIVNSSVKLLEYRTGKSYVNLASAQHAVQDLLRSWNLVFPRDPEVSGAVDMTKTGFIEAMNKRKGIWEDAWAQLRPVLDSLKRGGRLAPARPNKTNPAVDSSPQSK